MRNPVILSLACALAGCSTANISGQAGSLAATGAPQAGVNIQGGSAAGVIVAVVALSALTGAWRDAPGMLEGRAISEVDCTQPIADWSKNLKCR